MNQSSTGAFPSPNLTKISPVPVPIEYYQVVVEVSVYCSRLEPQTLPGCD